MQASSTDNADSIPNHDIDFLSQIQNKELLQKIDPNIKVELRKYYLMILHGQKIPKKFKTLLLQNIKDILNHE